MKRRAAATDRLVENDEGMDWSRITAPAYPNGPRFASGCPEDDLDCNDDGKVRIDPITFDEFDIGKPVMVLGCGHCYNPDSLARWVRQKKSRKCMYDDNYDMSPAELKEIGVAIEEVGGPFIEDLTGLAGVNGASEFFRVEGGALVLTIVQFPNGQQDIFDGPLDEERKVRSRHLDGKIDFFEGSQDQERRIRTEWPDGQMDFFSGEKDEEFKEHTTLPTGDIEYFFGTRGEERLIRVEFVSGQVSIYEGDRDEERMVRSYSPDGEVQLFEGPRGEERKESSQLPNGDVYTYEGPQGEEHIVSRIFNGRRYIYEGPKGEERVIAQREELTAASRSSEVVAEVRPTIG